MPTTSARLHRTVTLATAAGVTVLVLAACGSTGAGTMASPSPSGMGGGMGMGGTSPDATWKSASGRHNATDVAFLMQMIPHHTQAVAMADLAATRAKSAQVRMLAAQIKAAQGPEITEMSGWLRGWSIPVPSGEMSGEAMSGMMSAADMTTLAKLTGTAFDRTWLTTMTTHHEGALTMARTELTAGSNPDATTLARSIITSQTAQITRMTGVLSQLPAS